MLDQMFTGDNFRRIYDRENGRLDRLPRMVSRHLLALGMALGGSGA